MAARARKARPPTEDSPLHVEGISPDVRDAVDRAFGEEVVPSDLKGNKWLLDILQGLPVSDPLRLGLTARLEHVGPDHIARLVPGVWDDQLPTYEFVGSMVASGNCPAGNFRVTLKHTNRMSSTINFSVAAPIKPGEGGTAGPHGSLREAMALVRDMQPATDDHQAVRDVTLQVDRLAAELARLVQRQDATEAAMRDLVRGLQEAQAALPEGEGEGEEGGVVAEVVKGLADHFLDRGGVDPALNGESAE